MSFRCLLGFHNYRLAVDRGGHRNDYHERCVRCERPKPHTLYWSFWRARDWETEWGWLEE